MLQTKIYKQMGSVLWELMAHFGRTAVESDDNEIHQLRRQQSMYSNLGGKELGKLLLRMVSGADTSLDATAAVGSVDSSSASQLSMHALAIEDKGTNSKQNKFDAKILEVVKEFLEIEFKQPMRVRKGVMTIINNVFGMHKNNKVEFEDVLAEVWNHALPAEFVTYVKTLLNNMFHGLEPPSELSSIGMTPANAQELAMLRGRCVVYVLKTVLQEECLADNVRHWQCAPWLHTVNSACLEMLAASEVGLTSRSTFLNFWHQFLSKESQESGVKDAIQYSPSPFAKAGPHDQSIGHGDGPLPFPTPTPSAPKPAVDLTLKKLYNFSAADYLVEQEHVYSYPNPSYKRISSQIESLFDDIFTSGRSAKLTLPSRSFPGSFLWDSLVFPQDAELASVEKPEKYLAPCCVKLPVPPGFVVPFWGEITRKPSLQSIGPICVVEGQSYWMTYSGHGKALSTDAFSPAHYILEHQKAGPNETATMTLESVTVTLFSRPDGRISADDASDSEGPARKLRRTASSSPSKKRGASGGNGNAFTMVIPFLSINADAVPEADPVAGEQSVLKLTLAKDAGKNWLYKFWSQSYQSSNLPTAIDAFKQYATDVPILDGAKDDKGSQDRDKSKQKWDFKHLLT